MKRLLSKLLNATELFGIDMRRAYRSLFAMPGFVSDFFLFLRQRKRSSHPFDVSLFPCVTDKYSPSGEASGHYFHQDFYVARRIFENKPQRHVDVGSRIDGFVAHVATFRQIDVIDIRPLGNITNVQFLQADIMRELPESLTSCTDSASCLHALEHFGLGRYGDPIDYEGHIKGLHNLHALLKPKGQLYLSVPIGPQRVEFNGHRVFAVPYLLRLFSELFSVEKVSAIDDQGTFHEGLPNNGLDFQCQYGCGIFELIANK